MRERCASSRSIVLTSLLAGVMLHQAAAHSILSSSAAHSALEPRVVGSDEATPLPELVALQSASGLTVSKSFELERTKGSSSMMQPSRFGPESPTVLGAPGDWLFSVATTECNGNVVYDSSPDTALSKVLLVLLLAGSILAVAGGPWISSPGPEAACAAGPSTTPQETTPLATPQDASPTKGERLYYADFCRICAIGCVVFEHCGGTSYTYRNVGFGLWWALPYLYMTSGMLYTLSKSTLHLYVLRLFAILMVGVSANLVGDMVSGRDWRGDFPNTVFQMWFVVMLMAMALLMAPLRQALHWHADHSGKMPARLPSSFKWWLFACGFLAVVGTGVHVLGIQMLQVKASSSWAVYYAPLVGTVPLMAVQIFGCAFLASLAALQSNPQATANVGWVLLAFLYIPMIVMPFDMDGFPHLIGLYIFSMVVTVKPLGGSEAISKGARAYWPFIFMFLCILAMPDMYGRCDVHPAGLMWERLRFSMGECTMVLLFATGALKCGDPFNVTGWMGWWSLYAYCFHVCWYRTLGTPAAAGVTFGSILPFYVMYQMGWLGKKPREKSLEKTASDNMA